jgi:hypothetical protein
MVMQLAVGDECGKEEQQQHEESSRRSVDVCHVNKGNVINVIWQYSI